MSKELEDLIRSLHWRSKEELEEYLKIIKERIKKNEDTKNE